MRVDVHEPAGPGPFPALVLLHGSGGAASYWLDTVAPMLAGVGVAIYAPHYFDKTGTRRATAETILDGRHFIEWLQAARDLVDFISARPRVNAQRIGVLGISLGAYLSIALAVEDRRIRAVVELSGGLPPGWEQRISPSLPPVLIIHGAKDDIVPVSEARKLESVLRGHGVTVATEILPEETHWFSYAARLRLFMLCSRFLSAHL